MTTRSLFGRRREVGRAVLLAGRVLAFSRAALGVALVAAPGPATTRWLGQRGQDDAAREVAVRGLGARDVVLGVGTLVALRSGSEVRHAARWIDACIVADLSDAASTSLARDLDVNRTFPVALALGAAAYGAMLRGGLR